jgi:hypothetical protein
MDLFLLLVQLVGAIGKIFQRQHDDVLWVNLGQISFSSVIATNGSFFVPNGVTKKCVDTRSDHIPKALGRAGHKRTESVGEELELI